MLLLFSYIFSNLLLKNLKFQLEDITNMFKDNVCLQCKDFNMATSFNTFIVFIYKKDISNFYFFLQKLHFKVIYDLNIYSLYCFFTTLLTIIIFSSYFLWLNPLFISQPTKYKRLSTKTVLVNLCVLRNSFEKIQLLRPTKFYT